MIDYISLIKTYTRGRQHPKDGLTISRSSTSSQENLPSCVHIKVKEFHKPDQGSQITGFYYTKGQLYSVHSGKACKRPRTPS